MGLLTGKRLLITGVISPSSIAYRVAEMAAAQGAQIVLTGYGRLSLVERVAKRLPDSPPVLELDVTDDAHLASLSERLRQHVDGLDGVLHSVAFAPPGALGGGFVHASRRDVMTAFEVSTYSLQALTTAVLPLLGRGSSVVGLDFDASRAWLGYDWMGVAKAGMESCARYLASYLGHRGIRVNLVAAGPLATLAARSISSESDGDGLTGDWPLRAPLGWDCRDATPVASACVALFSDLFPATTGEIIHVDGGAHAIGDRAAVAAPILTEAAG